MSLKPRIRPTSEDELTNQHQVPPPKSLADRNDRPLASYLALGGVYVIGFVGFLASAKRAKRPLPERIDERDLLLLGMATHKLSKIIAKDRVTTPLRAPFVEVEEKPKQGTLEEKPAGKGLQQSLGQLLTCNYCLGPWIGAGLVAALSIKPRETRLFSSAFAVVAVSDFMHQFYSICQKQQE